MTHVTAVLRDSSSRSPSAHSTRNQALRALHLNYQSPCPPSVYPPASVRRLRCSTLSPLTPGTPTYAWRRRVSSTSAMIWGGRGRVAWGEQGRGRVL